MPASDTVTQRRRHARPQKVTDWVYDAIRDAIISRELPPGGRVTESALAEWLQVSKTPVREALLRLHHVGLIESEGSRAAARVVQPSRVAIRNAFEIRQALEAQAARLVAERGASEDLDEILDAARRSFEAAGVGDLEAFRGWDRRMHHAIAGATNNDALQERIADIFALTWTLRKRDVPSVDHSERCAAQHMKVAEAIAARDADAAARAMHWHVQTSMDAVLAAAAEIPDAP